jgi:HPt (histidine-containing phosphotransfer) domain-containing protein
MENKSKQDTGTTDKPVALAADDSWEDGKAAAVVDALAKMGLDVKNCLARFVNKKHLYCDVVKDFCLFFPQLSDEISAHLAGKNMEGFRNGIHSLKSMFGNIGAVALAKKIERLEAAAQKESIAFCDEQYIYLRKELHKLYEQIAVFFPVQEGMAREPGNPADLRAGIEKANTAVYDNDVALEALQPLLAYDFGEEANGVLARAIAAFNKYDIEGAKELLKGV